MASTRPIFEEPRFKKVSAAPPPPSRPYAPPDRLPLEKLRVDLPSAPGDEDPIDQHNRAVGELVARFNGEVRMRPLDPHTVKLTDVLDDRDARRSAMLSVLQCAAATAQSGATICRDIGAAWMAHRQVLQTSHEKLLEKTRQQLAKIYPSDCAFAFNGAL